MKGFLVGMTLSTTLLLGVVYTTIKNPGLFANFLKGDDVSHTEIVDIEEKIEELQEEIVEDTPFSDDYQKHLEQGDIFVESEHLDLAIAEYETAVQLAPDWSAPYYRLGRVYFLKKNYDEAEHNLQIAYDIASNDNDVQVLLGRTWLEQEQFEQAETHFNKLNSNTPDVLYYQAVLKAYSGDYEGAQSIFEALRQASEEPEASETITFYREKVEHYLGSIQEFSGAEDISGLFQKTLIARSLSETNENALAIDLAYQVLGEDGEYRDAWIILGYTYLTQEAFEEAQEALIRAVELDPDKAESRYFLGLSYFGLDEMESAVAQLELALTHGFEPQVQAYQKLGDAAVILEEYSKAANAYEQVISLNSSDPEIFTRPVWIYLDKLNNTPRAIQLAEEAVAKHPDSAIGYNLMGWALTLAGDRDGAKQNLNQALSLNPQMPAAYLNLGRWYELDEQWDEALNHYQRAYTLDPSGSIGLYAGERYNAVVEIIEQQSQTEASTSSSPTF